VPITSLAFYSTPPPSSRPLVLAGEDNALSVYEAASGRLRGRVDVFDEQPIHGIWVPTADYETAAAAAAAAAAATATCPKMLVWGGRSIAILRLDGLDADEGLPTRVARASAADWIYAAAICPWDQGQLVLATAHNEVVSMRNDGKGRLVVEQVVSPSRPNLYAAALTWLADDSVLMAAGTAFGEILLWRCWLGRHQVEGEAPYEMLAVLTGHEGSIYGVDISPTMALPGGGSLRLLATCSDDRTVRIWDITDRGTAQGRECHQPLDAPRETGFGGSMMEKAKAPVAMAMGHISRIWGVRIAATADSLSSRDSVHVYSFGEDATTQKWQLTLDTTGEVVTGTLTPKQEFALNDGKHLWARTVLPLGKKTFIATGGADGKISVVEDPAASASPENTLSKNRGGDGELLTLKMADIRGLAPIANKGKSSKGEIVQRYAFLTSEGILATTSTGRLLYGSIRGECLSWEEISIQDGMREKLKSSYVMKRAGESIAVIGMTDGSVYFYNHHAASISLVDMFPQRVFDIGIISAGNDRCLVIEILVHMIGVSNPRYLILDAATGTVRGGKEVSGLDPRFITVSSTKIENLLLMGSRHGYLTVLMCKEGRYRPVLNQAPRSGDAITAIVPLGPIVDGFVSFITTGRDGKYRIYEFETGDADDEGVREAKLYLRHESSTPFGPMIEGAWITRSDGDARPEIVLYGFRSKNFIVWNETRREERAAVDCGGSHRTFDFYHGHSDMDLFRFAFTRASKLLIHSQTAIHQRVLRRGIHGREIRALCASGQLVATGAEDTSIRIWDHRELVEQRQPRCLASIKAHVAGIQKVKWLGEDTLFSSGGNEEFFVWRVRRLRPAWAGLGVVLEASMDDKSPDSDLRIMDFDVSQGVGDSSGGVVVTMAFSNSGLKTYRYTAEDGFQLLARGAYTGACLTQARHLHVSEGSDSGLSLLTASTDGHVVLWTMQQDASPPWSWAPVQVVRIHQSCIKSLDVLASGEDAGCTVVTGGDDNALGLITLQLASSEMPGGQERRYYQVSGHTIIERAHAGAINGLVAWRQDDGQAMAATVSNDQRLKVWKVRPAATDDDVPLAMEVCYDAYSGVADPGEVELLARDNDKAHDQGPSRTLIVGGVGLEVWNLALT
jgi:WD40 repeat protein